MRSRSVIYKTQWWTMPDLPVAHPMGLAINVVFKTQWQTLLDPPAVPPRGPAINIFFKLGGGSFQTHRQCTTGGPPSTPSSTSMVDAAGPTGSTPRGATIDVLQQLVAIACIHCQRVLVGH
jgi:hypothetical protein